MSASSMIAGGFLERTIDVFRRAGGGQRGRQAARDYLNRSNPNESVRSINVVLREAEDAVRNAQRINRLGAGTVVGRDRFGDAADLERSAGLRGRTAAQVRVRIDWTDASGRVVFTTTGVADVDWRMTRQQLIDSATQQAAQRGQVIRNTPRARQIGQDSFDRDPQITIEAAYTRLVT